MTERKKKERKKERRKEIDAREREVVRKVKEIEKMN